MKKLNVKDFGALGNGSTFDGKAFERAINALCDGDVLFVPDGVYPVGSVFLKSNVTLELGEKAVLKGSDDINDYKTFENEPDNRYFSESDKPYGVFPKHAVLNVAGAKNVTVKGGEITFCDKAFDDVFDNSPAIIDENYICGVGFFRQPSKSYVPKGPRPVGLYISHSSGVKTEGVKFTSCPVYSCWSVLSDDLVFDGVTIRNNAYQWNGDGLHFSACKNVGIFGCDIEASDDCVAIDGNAGGESSGFFIHDNSLKTTIHAIRLFTGLDLGMEESCDGDYKKFSVHNVKIENNVVPNATSALLVCAFDGDVFDVEMKNSTCTLDYEGTALSFNAKAGTIYDFKVENCKFDCNGAGYFCAENEGNVSGVTLKNCEFSVTPKTKIWGVEYEGKTATHGFSMPYNLTFKNVKKVVLDGVKLHFNEPVFSNTLKESDRDAIITAVGKEKLAEIEPKRICAVTNVNSNVIIKNCELTDS